MYGTSVSRVKLYGEPMSDGVLTGSSLAPELSTATGSSKDNMTPKDWPDMEPDREPGQTRRVGGMLSVSQGK